MKHNLSRRFGAKSLNLAFNYVLNRGRLMNHLFKRQLLPTCRPADLRFTPAGQRPIEVHTDTLKRGVGTILAQEVDGRLIQVRFTSWAFSDSEAGWHTVQMELFGVKWALQQFRPYVLGKRAKVVTDHTNLKWITSVKLQQSKLARWCLSMSEFDFFIVHKPGERTHYT